MLVLINGTAFISCVFGVIYVGAMGVLFIVFLSYTGTEKEVSKKLMFSAFSSTSFIFINIMCFTHLPSESAGEIQGEPVELMTKQSTCYFHHLYTSYYSLFVILLVSLLIGLVATLALVGVSR